LLANSGGKLPPYIIVCGDRERVASISQLLDDVLLVDRHMQGLGLKTGRVAIAVGLFKGTPIAVVEHQMGCGAVEIICREIWSDQCSATTFVTSAHAFHAPGKFSIRVGSCGVMNDPADEKAAVFKAFDVVVTSHQVGVSGCDVQSATGTLNLFDPAWRETAMRRLAQFGFVYTAGARSPEVKMHVLDSRNSVQAALVAAAGSLKAARREFDPIAVHEAGNCSKDSLYAECRDEAFIELRREFGCGSSEMEFSSMSCVAAMYREGAKCPPVNVELGMVLIALGVIPGASFELESTKVGFATRLATLSALEALHALSLQHRRPL